MHAYSWRFAPCKNQKCGRRIWLPFSEILGTNVLPPGTPRNENIQIFACPDCGYAADYKATANPPDYQSDCFPQDDPYRRDALFLETVEFPCEACGCQVRIHTPSEPAAKLGELRTRAENFKLAALCPNGHGLVKMPDEFRVNRYTHG